MKIKSEERILETQGFDQFQQKGFSIKQSARAFEVLSSNLYSNKVKAIVRELGCNAWDAHVDRDKLIDAGTASPFLAPKGTPFAITLPTTFQPMFIIRDYGIGLKQEDVLGLYSTYFQSTKEQSNDTIGAFGLGSKSPFCYTEQFTVTSYFNGEKKTYSAFIGEEGAPSIALLTTETTTEKNGISIAIPVEAKDYIAFEVNVKEVFRFFTKNKPVVTGKPSDFIPEVTVEGKKYSHFFRSNLLSSFSVRQGNVVYPVDTNAFSFEKLSPNHAGLTRWGFLVDVPIGSVNVTASRERLNYDRNTEKFLVKLFDSMLDEIKQDFDKELSKVKTQWDATVFFAKYLKNNSFYSSFLAGKEISKDVSLSQSYQVALYTDTEETDHSGKRTKVRKSDYTIYTTTFYVTKYNELESFYVVPEVDGTIPVTFVFDDEHSHNYKQKLTFVEATNATKLAKCYRPYGNVYWIRRRDPSTSTADALKFFKERFRGFDNFVLSSTLPNPPKVAKQTTQTRKLLKMDLSGDWFSWKDATHDMNNGGYFVYTVNGAIEDMPVYRQVIDEASEAGILKDIDIFGVPRGNRKAFDADKDKVTDKWFELKPYLVKKVKEFAEQHDFTQLSVLKEGLESIPLNWATVFDAARDGKMKLEGKLGEVLNEYILFKVTVEPFVTDAAKEKINAFIQLATLLKLPTNTLFPISNHGKTEKDYNFTLTKDVKQLTKDYPLIDLINFSNKVTSNLKPVEDYLNRLSPCKKD